jgi:hypothetical protein
MDFPLDRYDYYDYKRVKHGNDEISAKLCGLPDLPIPLQTIPHFSVTKWLMWRLFGLLGVVVWAPSLSDVRFRNHKT